MANQDFVELCALLDEYGKEGRDVRLRDVFGQTMFSIYTPSGALRTDCAIYPLLRGKGDHPPKYEGTFPLTDGEILELGEGWAVMCVTFDFGDTAATLRGKLEAADKKLRALKHVR